MQKNIDLKDEIYKSEEKLSSSIDNFKKNDKITAQNKNAVMRFISSARAKVHIMFAQDAAMFLKLASVKD